MDAPFAAKPASQPPIDSSTEPAPSKKARTVAEAAAATVWTTDQAVVEMGDRFDAWIAESDSWIDPAPGRREQYIQDGSLFCLSCKCTVIVTIDNARSKVDHESSSGSETPFRKYVR
jgi:hypothetical protein